MTHGIHLKTAIRDFVHTLIRPSAPPAGEGSVSGLFPDLNDALPTNSTDIAMITRARIAQDLKGEK